MKHYYTLSFLFLTNSHEVLLVNSNKFPTLWNGIGSEYHSNRNILEIVAEDFKREVGVVLNTPVQPRDFFATIEGPDYEVYCFRIFQETMTIDSTLRTRNGSWCTFPYQNITNEAFAGHFAPRVPTLITAALEYDLAPIKILETAH